MTEALRACPWCDTVPNMTDNLATDSGSKAQIGKWAWIECDCGARGPDTRANWGQVADWQQDASDAWNCRAPVALPTREEVAEVIRSGRAYEATSDQIADAILNLMRERMG